MPQKKIGGLVHKFDSHYRRVAQRTQLSAKEVKVAVEQTLVSVVEQTTRYGSSKLAGMLKFKLKTKSNALPGEWKAPGRA